MPSHQALLLQAQDDEIEDQDTERQHAPIQYPKLADIMGEEFRNDEVFSQHPCSSNKNQLSNTLHRQTENNA